MQFYQLPELSLVAGEAKKHIVHRYLLGCTNGGVASRAVPDGSKEMYTGKYRKGIFRSTHHHEIRMLGDTATVGCRSTHEIRMPVRTNIQLYTWLCSSMKLLIERL
jgi:hypothetical protein